jgi:hypothetical protein
MARPSRKDLPAQPGPLQLSRPIRGPPMNPVTSHRTVFWGEGRQPVIHRVQRLDWTQEYFHDQAPRPRRPPEIRSGRGQAGPLRLRSQAQGECRAEARRPGLHQAPGQEWRGPYPDEQSRQVGRINSDCYQSWIQATNRAAASEAPSIMVSFWPKARPPEIQANPDLASVLVPMARTMASVAVVAGNPTPRT